MKKILDLNNNNFYISCHFFELTIARLHVITYWVFLQTFKVHQ